MSLFVPVWGLIVAGGIAGWTFGFRVIGAVAVIGGLVMGGFINF